MPGIMKTLVGLAALAFLCAVFTVLAWPIYGLPAESFSRAANNLALLAIATHLVCDKIGAESK